jgi:hypothetical protein
LSCMSFMVLNQMSICLAIFAMKSKFFLYINKLLYIVNISTSHPTK